MTTAPLQHLALIMDGNGRWATRQGLPRLAGHKAGVTSLNTLVEALVRQQIPYASFYAFSTENWGRSVEEVTGIFALLEYYFTQELARLKAHNIRLRFLGDHSEASPLNPRIRAIIANATAETAANTGTTLLIALNYGGHDELVRATRKVAASGQEITAQTLEAALDTAGVPPPDLLIRTSGEQRLSGFLPWQLAYTELYFTPTLWPDFGPAQLDEALAWYASRQRRFGKV
ncbi:MAG: di-trans,poly-cis-decaprenylcistransferase [Alphaproteobacteria bacterium]|jgi:undecaprenyl diphosphate synthase|nr:di-trans,poly-cis-decaprenylcistransferase [Alphaproteobacteria bacterium]